MGRQYASIATMKGFLGSTPFVMKLVVSICSFWAGGHHNMALDFALCWRMDDHMEQSLVSTPNWKLITDAWTILSEKNQAQLKFAQLLMFSKIWQNVSHEPHQLELFKEGKSGKHSSSFPKVTHYKSTTTQPTFCSVSPRLLTEARSSKGNLCLGLKEQ